MEKKNEKKKKCFHYYQVFFARQLRKIGKYQN